MNLLIENKVVRWRFLSLETKLIEIVITLTGAPVRKHVSVISNIA